MPFRAFTSLVQIVDFKAGSVVVVDVKLRKVAVLMLALAVLVCVDHVALKCTEEACNGVGVRIARNVLAG
jgi:hypothetical protein